MSPAPRRSLLFRMAATVLPLGALPLLAFGAWAAVAQFSSLREQAAAMHLSLAQVLSAELNREGRDAQLRLEDLAATGAPLVEPALATAVLKRYSSTSAPHRFLVLSPAFKILAAEPPDTLLTGKSLAEVDGAVPVLPATWGKVVRIDHMAPSFFGLRRLETKDGVLLGYAAIEVGLEPWVLRASRALSGEPALLAAVIPEHAGEPVLLSASLRPDAWAKVAALRVNDSTAPSQSLAGEAHQVTSLPLPWLRSRLVLAESLSVIDGPARSTVVLFGGALLLLALGLSGGVYLVAMRVGAPLRSLTASVAAVGGGSYETRVSTHGDAETAALAAAFNAMAQDLGRSHQRTRTLHRIVTELFACSSFDGLMRKVVELACTQCHADVAYFLPQKVGREITFAGEPLFIGVRPWAWRQHRSTEFAPEDAATLWPRLAGDHLLTFRLKGDGTDLGQLTVAYREPPEDEVSTLLHSLVSLVDVALIKQAQGARAAAIATELEMAQAVQDGMMSDPQLSSLDVQVAYHYQPAGRLGGDWFYMIEDTQAGCLYIVMGDVTGHGLAQGLVTTAVKGALDALTRQIQAPRRADDPPPVGGPAAVVQLLQSVVQRVGAGNHLTMTCLAAQIDYRDRRLSLCNAGHTFPILIQQAPGGSQATHLHRSQQPLLGQDGARPVSFEEASYDLRPNDLLIVYTDGLTAARNLKSQIFGRFLFRTLKQGGPYASATGLRDDILDMFRYYTQDTRLDDDVCFVVVQLTPTEAVAAA